MKTPVLWINLNRRKDRAAWFIDRNISLFPNLHWIRVAGFDPWWDAFAQSEPKATSHGHAGCWLSHKAALQIGLATGASRFVILEDDAILSPDFGDILEEITVLPGKALKLGATMVGTYGVLYTAEAAVQCLNLMELRTDNFDRQLENTGIYYPSEHRYLTHFDGTQSDTEIVERPKGPIDFSQHGEQEIITNFFGQKIGRFLDLGAYDGMEGSNTRGLSDRHWKGVCVEANPFTFQKLIQNHSGNPNIQCLNAAVAPQPGIAKFWDTGGQVSTILSDHSVSQWVQREYSVACVTPDQIVKQFGDDFDFVSIDIEGMDLDVVRVGERLLRNASLICVEHSQPSKPFSPDYYSEIRKTLSRMGFKRLIASTGDGGLNPDPSKASNSILARE